MDAIFDFSGINAAIFDMDGVIWRGSEILPGVPDLFLFLREHNIPYAMATNNATRQVGEYVARLQSLGVPVEPQYIITSGLVTLETLTRSYPPGTPIYVFGPDSLKELLVSQGYVVDPEKAAVVIVGLDRNISYEKLSIAGQRIMAGAEFIGTNSDATLPTPTGEVPGAGTFVAAVSAMTGRKPRLMGKPEPDMFNVALERLGSTPECTLMIGDRFETDIEGAQRAGLRTALVLTGVSTRDDIGDMPPNGVFDDLASILTAWKQVLS